MFPDENTHSFIPRHHNLTHPAALLPDAVSILEALPRVVKEAFPVIPVPRRRPPAAAASQQLIEMTRRHAVQNRAKSSRVRHIPVRKKQRVRLPVPHLQRADIQYGLSRARIRKHIQKKLRRLTDFGDRLRGMHPAEQRKIRNGVPFIQIRTGHAEEIAHHQVRGPGGLQLRKAVEEEERLSSRPLDDAVNLYRKNLKAVRQRDRYHLHHRLCRRVRHDFLRPDHHRRNLFQPAGIS